MLAMTEEWLLGLKAELEWKKEGEIAEICPRHAVSKSSKHHQQIVPGAEIEFNVFLIT